MRFAPIDDVLVVVAARDGPAHDQEQYLPQRIGHLPRLSRILDHRQVIEKHTQMRLGRPGFHLDPPESEGPTESAPSSRRKKLLHRQAQNRVNLTSPPWVAGW